MSIDQNVPVPRRHAIALERMARRVGVAENEVASLWTLVPESDGVGSWSGLLQVPRVRARWVGEGTEQLVEIEFTPIGASVPEWRLTKKYPTGWAPGTNETKELVRTLLDRGFAGSLLGSLEPADATIAVRAPTMMQNPSEVRSER